MPYRPSDQYVTIARAAHILGVKRYAVLAAISRGELVTQTVAERAVVTKESLDRLLVRRQEVAR